MISLRAETQEFILIVPQLSTSVLSCFRLFVMECSLPGSSVHGIFQARVLEWVVISYSRGSSWLRNRTWISCVSCTGRRLCATGEAHKSVAAAKPLQSCPILCDPINGSPPGFPIPGILKVRTLEWVAISFSNVWKWSRSVVSNSSRPPWTAAYQAPPSMGFSRQEHWSGVPLPSAHKSVRHI